MNVKSLPLVGSVGREVAPWIEGLARFGFVAKGILYMTVSALAASAALGLGGKHDADSHSALQRLFTVPYGRVFVGVIAIGLVGYSVWRIVEGITDPQRRGHDVKGIAVRASFVVRGVLHLMLAATAGALAVWSENGGGNSKRIEEWTGRTMDLPGGSILLWAIAGGLIGYGLYQIYNAYRAKLSKQLRLKSARRAIIAVSRFGIGARGVVFCTIGWLLARAANQHDPKAAGGVGDSLHELLVFGKWPFLAIALGLGAYGIYELINAKYRRIDV